MTLMGFCALAQVARDTNAELLNLPDGWEAADPASILATVANELQSVQELTRMAALLWLNTLLSRSRRTVCLILALPLVQKETLGAEICLPWA